MHAGPMPSLPRRLAAALLAGGVVLAGCGLAPGAPTPSAVGSATPISAASPGALPLPSVELRGEITAEDIERHLDALASIAGEHGGIRAAGTAGYEASVDYVAAQLRELGYEVATPGIEIDTFGELPGAVLAVSGGGPTFIGGQDFNAMIYSAGAKVSAQVATVGFADSPGGAGQGGCADDDWDEFPPGSIALTPPGPCFRRQGALHAVEAGALALVVAYPDRDAGEVLRPTLLSGDGMEIPVLAASREVGEALLEATEEEADVSISVETDIERATVRNVVADTPTGDDRRVAVLGAHLDSVLEGPGINDNGSGVAALLEAARLLLEDGADPGGTVRFGFWAGEELGLLGSSAYVHGLSAAELESIEGYVNLDMLGSVNAVPFVYRATLAPPGSLRVSDFLMDWLESEGIGAEPLGLGGGSDHQPFAEAGVPVGGIFSGASDLKGPEQALEFGGEVGEPYDPCYHLACDGSANVDAGQVAAFAEAAAAVGIALARGELLP